MKKYKYTCVIFASTLCLALLSGCGQIPEEEFRNWKEIKNAPPKWFKDAKFGIYFHWGVYTVPAYHSEWYSRNMYYPGSEANQHHLEHYGSLSEFGYKDFVPMFKAEKFDPDAWVDLFVRAGARFAGPVAEHADGFSMWDSEVNSWNANDCGPGIDVVGAMEEAVRKRDLKFITTFHHQWHWGWYPTFKDKEEADAGDPAYTELYGPVVPEAAWKHEDNAPRPDEEFNQFWARKVKEVIDGYNPDMIYFDTRLGHIKESYRKEIVTRFLENNRRRGKKGQGIILHKDNDLPADVSVQNHEKSRMNQLSDYVWQTEEPITTFSWSYTQDMELRPAEDILHSLVDIVSKNGVYLLNIAPKSDGTIPADQKEILLSIGQWLNNYGETIYGTRPWYRYGEGPRYVAENSNDENDEAYHELNYTANDIRYTTKGDIVFAILLGQPEGDQQIELEAFSQEMVPESFHVIEVSLLGADEKPEWIHPTQGEGLIVTLPHEIPETMATVLKIKTSPD